MKPLFGVNNELLAALIGEVPPYCTGVSVEFKHDDFVMVTVTQALPDEAVSRVRRLCLGRIELEPTAEASGSPA